MQWVVFPAVAVIVAAWLVIRRRVARLGRDRPTPAEEADEGPEPVIWRFPGPARRKAE